MDREEYQYCLKAHNDVLKLIYFGFTPLVLVFISLTFFVVTHSH